MDMEIVNAAEPVGCKLSPEKGVTRLIEGSADLIDDKSILRVSQETLIRRP